MTYIAELLKGIETVDDSNITDIPVVKDGFLEICIPAQYHKHVLNYQDRIEERIIDKRKQIVWLTGVTGCGKTTTMYALQYYYYPVESKLFNEARLIPHYGVIRDRPERITMVDEVGSVYTNAYVMWYYNLFDYVNMYPDRMLVISSNIKFEVWIKRLSEINNEMAQKINSRSHGILMEIVMKNNDFRCNRRD